jgi:hypothetical protein
MKAITKRDLVRKPSIVSALKPGEALAIRDGDSELVVTRKSDQKLSSDQIEEELQKIFKGAPQLDCQAILDDLRG